MCSCLNAFQNKTKTNLITLILLALIEVVSGRFLRKTPYRFEHVSYLGYDARERALQATPGMFLALKYFRCPSLANCETCSLHVRSQSLENVKSW